MMSVSSLRLVVADRLAASRQGARPLADELASPQPVLGLATGSSVELVYEELAALVSADPTLRSGIGRAQAFALDEYVGLTAGDPNSSPAPACPPPCPRPPRNPAATTSRSAPRAEWPCNSLALAATATSASTSPV